MKKKEKLNVMFMLTSMPVGGAETLLVNLVRGMDLDRFNPMVCCLKELGPLGEEIQKEFPTFHNFLSNKYDVRVFGRLTRLLREKQIDAIVTVGAGDKMFWGRLAAKRARIPVVLSALHSTGWPDGVGKLNRMLTPITDGFIAVAKEHGKFLAEFEGFPEDKVFVIPNGIDTKRFAFDAQAREKIRSEVGIPQDAKVTGIVAALREEKDHALFVKVAAKVKQNVPNAHFMIVGDGPERPAIEALAGELDLTDRLHMLGSRSDIPELLSAMDLFSLTSKNEANPVSIIEAMACHVPVVAPDVGSISDNVIDGETGFLYEVSNAEQAAEKWTKILSDDALAKEISVKAHEFANQNASLDSMVSGYEKLICKLYTEKARNRPSATKEAVCV